MKLSKKSFFTQYMFTKKQKKLNFSHNLTRKADIPNEYLAIDDARTIGQKEVIPGFARDGGLDRFGDGLELQPPGSPRRWRPGDTHSIRRAWCGGTSCAENGSS
jgi:hypothetical protein